MSDKAKTINILYVEDNDGNFKYFLYEQYNPDRPKGLETVTKEVDEKGLIKFVKSFIDKYTLISDFHMSKLKERARDTGLTELVIDQGDVSVNGDHYFKIDVEALQERVKKLT